MNQPFKYLHDYRNNRYGVVVVNLSPWSIFMEGCNSACLPLPRNTSNRQATIKQLCQRWLKGGCPCFKSATDPVQTCCFPSIKYTLVVSWRRAEYTVRNVETTTALFRANASYMVAPASLLVIVTSYYPHHAKLQTSPTVPVPSEIDDYYCKTLLCGYCSSMVFR